MTISSNGLQFIRLREGVELVAYQDSANVWTIGYGSTYYKNGKKVQPGDVISQAQADELFNAVATSFASQVNDSLKAIVNQNQFDALVSFAYNVGIGAFRKSTLLKKVNANPNDATIRNEFLKWNRAGGRVVDGLTKRRNLESNLYFQKKKLNSPVPPSGNTDKHLDFNRDLRSYYNNLSKIRK